jgi:hypothetical protein
MYIIGAGMAGPAAGIMNGGAKKGGLSGRVHEREKI